MSIVAKHIYKTFANKEVLHDISFTIQEGELVGLLGPNGAGKTTLMRILLGLLQPDKKISPAFKLKLPTTKGYLNEKNPLYEHMYVREYLSFMLELSKRHSPEKQSLELQQLIKDVGLTSEANKKIKELSKGYRQRVGMAQAIMADPELLILDEPTTGLDPNQIGEIRSLIRNMVNRQSHRPKVVILSTHILSEVKEMCSRVIILDKGVIKADKKIEEIGDLNRLFENATHND